MKKFYLLQLQYNTNKVLLEMFAINKKEAIRNFQNLRPDLTLDDDGYFTTNKESIEIYDGHISYCVAEQF